MSTSDDDALREKIAGMLQQGLETQVAPFPEDNHQFEKLLVELREIGPEQLEKKLVVSGFVDHPFGEEEQRCLECMYYLVHRKWCDLPELALPVEPQWWCRLWRI